MHTGPYLHYKSKHVRTLYVQCIVYDDVIKNDTSKHFMFYSREKMLDDMHINISI
jgi:hypothetical protein